MNVEKIKSMSLKELSELKAWVNEIVLRSHITGTPNQRWKDFNELLMVINKTIEDNIYHEYIG